MTTRVLTAAAMTLFALSSAAFVDIAGSQTGDLTYVGCVLTKTGALRVVGSDGVCTKAEYRITWSQTGPQGPKGEPGTGATVAEVSLAEPDLRSLSAITAHECDTPESPTPGQYKFVPGDCAWSQELGYHDPPLDMGRIAIMGQALRTDDYPAGAVMRLQASGQVRSWGTHVAEFCVRLFDVDHQYAVSGSEMCHSNSGSAPLYFRATSDPLALPPNGAYVIQVRNAFDFSTCRPYFCGYDDGSIAAASIVIDW